MSYEFDDIYTEAYLEALLQATLRVAPIIYKTKGHRLWGLEELDDFVQEALMHINNLFRQRYIKPLDPTKGTVDNLVSSLLSGTFLWNQQNGVLRDKYHDNLRITFENLSQDSKNSLGQLPGELLESLENTPHENYEMERRNKELQELINTLSKSPVASYKHTYRGYSKELGPITLTEYNIATLMLLGYSTQDIVEIFGLNNSKQKVAQANVVRQVIRRTLNNLKKNAVQHNLQII